MPSTAPDAGPAAALHAPAAPVTLDAYAAVDSQYVYRGVALRDRASTTLAVTTNVAHGWFADVWTAYVDGDAQTDYEGAHGHEWDVDASVGYGAALTRDWQWSLAAARIVDVGDGDSDAHDYYEWRAAAYANDVVHAQFAYSPDYQQRGWSSWNAELAATHALTDWLSGEIGFGHAHGAGREDGDYHYGWLGAGTSLWHTHWSARWVDAGHGARYVAGSDRDGSRFVLSASWGLHLLPR